MKGLLVFLLSLMPLVSMGQDRADKVKQIGDSTFVLYGEEIDGRVKLEGQKEDVYLMTGYRKVLDTVTVDIRNRIVTDPRAGIVFSEECIIKAYNEGKYLHSTADNKINVGFGRGEGYVDSSFSVYSKGRIGFVKKTQFIERGPYFVGIMLSYLSLLLFLCVLIIADFKIQMAKMACKEKNDYQNFNLLIMVSVLIIFFAILCSLLTILFGEQWNLWVGSLAVLLAFYYVGMFRWNWFPISYVLKKEG